MRMKQPCQKWQGCWFYGSRKDAGGMHREEGMPDSIRRNKNRGRDAGKAQREQGGHRGAEREGRREGLYVVISTSSPINDVPPKVLTDY